MISKVLTFISILVVLTVGCVSGHSAAYEAMPKKMTINESEYACYYSVHKSTSCTEASLIGYICQTGDNLRMVFTDDSYEYREILLSAFNGVVEKESIEVPVGGKTASGAYWDGIKRVKKGEPDYVIGFGDYFIKELNMKQMMLSKKTQENLVQKMPICIEKVFRLKRIDN